MDSVFIRRLAKFMHNWCEFGVYCVNLFSELRKWGYCELISYALSNFAISTQQYTQHTINLHLNEVNSITNSVFERLLVKIEQLSMDFFHFWKENGKSIKANITLLLQILVKIWINVPKEKYCVYAIKCCYIWQKWSLINPTEMRIIWFENSSIWGEAVICPSKKMFDRDCKKTENSARSHLSAICAL